MMSIAGLLEVVDSLILIGETQQRRITGQCFRYLYETEKQSDFHCRQMGEFLRQRL